MSNLEKELWEEGYREGCLEVLQRAPEDYWGDIEEVLVNSGKFSEEEVAEIIEDARKGRR